MKGGGVGWEYGLGIGGCAGVGCYVRGSQGSWARTPYKIQNSNKNPLLFTRILGQNSDTKFKAPEQAPV